MDSSKLKTSLKTERTRNSAISASQSTPLFRYIPPSLNWLIRTASGLGINANVQLVQSQNGRPVNFAQSDHPFHIQNVQGDGNCLFRSLAVVLLGSQDYHPQVREAIVNFIETDEQRRFVEYLGMEGVDYVSESGMRQLQQWGTDKEIAAAAFLFNCNIFVFDMVSEHENEKWKCYNAELETGTPTANVPSLLMRHPFNHFEPVLRMETSVDGFTATGARLMQQAPIVEDASTFTSAASFLEQAKDSLEMLYPTWRKIYNASPYSEKQTICIPDAPDVLPNRRMETCEIIKAEIGIENTTISQAKQNLNTKIIAFNRGLVGQNGEDEFVIAFRQLKLGGILIRGFNTEEFIKKIINKKNCKKWKQHFECDAIFLHHQLGAFLIEVKACDDMNVLRNRVDAAAEQLSKDIHGLKEIYRRINGEGDISFHGIICIPNATVTLSHEIYRVLGRTEICNKADFKQFWLLNKPLPIQQQIYQEKSNETITKSMNSFIAAIVAYRSTKFVSLPTNALEIYRIIEKQAFTKKANVQQINSGEYVKLKTMKAESIILNREQLLAVESMEQKLFISGPPGSGKTTVMLLRALSKAKLSRPGRVVIYEGSVSDQLRLLFQKFVADNQSDFINRQIIVEKSDSELTKNLEYALPDDDIFFDEMSVEFGDLKMFFENRPEWRKTARGSTTMIITGRWFPQQNEEEMRKALQYFDYFHHISLKTIIRGTRSIIDEWKRFIPDKSAIPGHNVKGAPVERIIVRDRNQLLITVHEKVTNYLLENVDSSIDHELNSSINLRSAFSPCHLAILISSTYHSAPRRHVNELRDIIKSSLTSKGFPCGSLKEQVNDENLIAIDFPNGALSFDWPVVIYIRGNDTDDSSHLIPLSRCISNLIVIEAAEQVFSTTIPRSGWSGRVKNLFEKFQDFISYGEHTNLADYNHDDSVLSVAICDRYAV